MALAVFTGNETTYSVDGDKKNVQLATLRSALASTTSYVATDTLEVGFADKVALMLTLAWVDSTSTEWYAEWSYDNSTWFRSTNAATSTGVNTMTANNQTFASGASAKIIHALDVIGKYLRVSVKKTGGAGGDTLAVHVMALSR